MVSHSSQSFKRLSGQHKQHTTISSSEKGILKDPLNIRLLSLDVNKTFCKINTELVKGWEYDLVVCALQGLELVPHQGHKNAIHDTMGL